MTDRFDPYHKWLGIPPKDQPPNHYRLLGLEMFESDEEVIDSAANRLMEYLQGVADGPHLREAQQLMNEISAARLVLLDAKKRSSYNESLSAELRPKSTRRLRGKRSSPPPAAPPAGPPPAPASASNELLMDAGALFDAPSPSPGHSPTSSRSRRHSPPWIPLAGMAVALGAVITVGFIVLGGALSDPPPKSGGPVAAKSTTPHPLTKTAGKTAPPHPADAAGKTKEPAGGMKTMQPTDPPKVPTDPPDPPPPASTTESDKLLAAAEKAIENKQLATAIEKLGDYLLDPEAPERPKAADLLQQCQIVNGVSDEAVMNDLARMSDAQLVALSQGQLQIRHPVVTNARLLEVFVSKFKSNVAKEQRRRLKKPPMKKEPTPPTKKPPTTKPEPDPTVDPEGFLAARGLKNQKAFWLLKGEAEFAEKLKPLKDVAKKYDAAEKALDNELNRLRPLRAQLKQAEQRIEQYRAANRQPPNQLVVFVQQLKTQIGGETETPPKIKTLVEAKIAALNELSLAVLKVRKDVLAVEETYQQLADDEKVTAALTKLSQGVRHRLGPSKSLRSSRAAFAKQEQAVLADGVPMYLQARQQRFPAIINETLPFLFTNRPEMNFNTIPQPVAERAGVKVEQGQMVRLTIGERTINCRRVIVPTLRIGKHVLKNKQFLAVPAEAVDLGAALGGGAFDGFKVNPDLETFTFELTPR